MDAVTDPQYETVVMMKSAQTGGTEIILNIVGYFIDQDPSPMLVVQPTLDMGKAWSKDRLAPMLRDSPCLHGKVKDSRSRDAENTTLHKKFSGGHITIAGSNSAASLASRPIRLVLLDEVDRFAESAGTEGSPIKLADKRAQTFWNRKKIRVSTPTVEGASNIEAEFNLSNQQYYQVPCPHCETYQILKWDNVKWPKGEPEKAYYACTECGGVIEESDKAYMIANGKWVPDNPESKIAGFHISELYSPWSSWAEMAVAFYEVKDIPERLKTWINTSLGEVWRERGESVEWENISQLRMPYNEKILPADVRAVTAAVDVQADRLYYSVRAWGAGFTSWQIMHGEIIGDTTEAHTWAQLSRLHDAQFNGYVIDRIFVDSGYRADMVYQFCRKHYGWAFPTKGHDSQNKPVRVSNIDVNIGGQVIKDGLQLVHIDTDYFKTWIHSRINWQPDQPGGWYLCENATDDYCKQIASESLLISDNGKRTWKQHSKNNHYLDVEVYNAAAAHMLTTMLMDDGNDPDTENKQDNPAPASQPQSGWLGDTSGWLNR